MNAAASTVIGLVLVLAAVARPACLAAQDGSAETAWKSEFERICGQTNIAVSLEQEQLVELINDSDKLLAELKESEDPGAKVYVFRLEKCKEFFEYTQELSGDD